MEGIKMKVVDINNLDKEVQTKDETVQQEQQEQAKEQGSEQGSEQDNELQKQEKITLKDEDVLGFLKNKGIEVNSFEDLTKPKTEIPEDIKSFLDYKKETGRDFKDFLELQKDWKSENEDVVLKRYLKDKNPYFTDEDVKDELSEFVIDELDNDIETRKKQREKRRLLSEALEHLETQKEQYKLPTERFSENGNVEIPEEYKTAKQKLNDIIKSQEDNANLFKQRQERFLNETKGIFNQEFKGFEFDINGNKSLFKSNDANELINVQSDINNVLSKYMDKDGNLTDVKGYHKFLNAGANADKLAQHYYELGKAEAIKEETIDSKNINLTGHKSISNRPLNGGGIKMKVVNPSDNRVRVR